MLIQIAARDNATSQQVKTICQKMGRKYKEKTVIGIDPAFARLQ